MMPEPLLDRLLDSFGSVFTEPTVLPPQHAHDHRITLKAGVLPMAVGPYRYPAAHKDELERQCAAMIEQGIVHRNDSLFSSPILLVKKPDESWRPCVNYRSQNTLTVKYVFPIRWWTSCRMSFTWRGSFPSLTCAPGTIRCACDRKTSTRRRSARTRVCTRSFLVMAFGLCNAPATFQALMNDILCPFICRFVLVFFDDILIYIKTWADHLRHLRAGA
jgi:hypothetical protein